MASSKPAGRNRSGQWLEIPVSLSRFPAASVGEPLITPEEHCSTTQRTICREAAFWGTASKRSRGPRPSCGRPPIGTYSAAVHRQRAKAVDDPRRWDLRCVSGKWHNIVNSETESVRLDSRPCGGQKPESRLARLGWGGSSFCELAVKGAFPRTDWVPHQQTH